MKIEYAKKAVKYIELLDKPTKQRIKQGIEGLTENPPKGDDNARLFRRQKTIKNRKVQNNI